MEFWIFIVLSMVGVLIISIIAIVVRCVGYKKVFEKIRSRTMSSSQNSPDPEAAQAPTDINLPAPPAYTVSFQHPIIARSSVMNTSTENERSSLPDPEISAADPETQSHPVPDQIVLGAAFPADAEIFVPPPYCSEPPAYSEAIEDVCSEGSVEAPKYTEY